MLLDEGAGLVEFGAVGKEASAVQVDVGQMQRHRPAEGDRLGLVKRGPRAGVVPVVVAIPRQCQQAARAVVLHSRFA